jgi:hypothetical protein
MDEIILTRQQLYELVWSASLLTPSKKYQIFFNYYFFTGIGIAGNRITL